MPALVLCLLLPCLVLARELHGFRPLGADLSHKTVHALLQDSNGFIWVGTLDGLNRFDGYQFVTWRHDPGRSDSLSSSMILCLLEDAPGGIWVGTDRGLNRVDRSSGAVERVAIQADSGQAVGSVLALLQAGGFLWAGTDLGLFQLRNDQWRALDLTDGAPFGSAELPIFSLAVGGETIYALSRQTHPPLSALVEIEEGGARYRWTTVQSDQGLVYALGVSSTDEVWVDLARPLAALSAGVSEHQAGGQPIWSFAETANGQIWLGTDTGLVDGSDAQRRRYLMNPSPQAFLSNFARSLLVDDAGELWLGTFDGLYRSLPAFRPFRHLGYSRGDAQSLSTAAVASIFEDSSGRLWIGTYGGGLNRVRDDGAVDHLATLGHGEDRLENAVIWDLGEDFSGQILVGTPAGLYRLDPETGHSYRTPVVDTRGAWAVVRQIRKTAEQIWLGTFDGLVRYQAEDRSEHVWPPPEGDEPDRIVESMEVRGPYVWLGMTGRSVVRFDIRTREVDYFSLPADFVGATFWDVHIRADGGVLLGTSGGLMTLNDRGELTAFDESLRLAGPVVYGIAEDAQSNIWLGTNHGLARLDAETGAVRSYHAADGTGNREYNRHAARSLANGDLAFGGMEGLTRFDPLAIRDNPRPPPVVVTLIEVHSSDGVRQLGARETLDLNHSDYTFAVEFAALDYADPQSNQYRYRLQGFERDWVEAGTRRRATYTNMPAGEYQLEIQGSNNDGVWNRAGTRLRVRIAPPYWETGWFRLLVGLLIAAIAAMVYRLRVSYLLRLERVRLQIAGDLHDEIGSDLSGIAIASDVVRRELNPGEAGQEHLKEITSIALRTATNLRDIVWYINPDHDRGRSLHQRMQATAQSMLAKLEYRLEFDDAVDHSTLDMKLRRNIHLVFKEALNNILKHARARVVEIRVRNIGGHFELEILDDGQGYDPAAESAGTGLLSMRHRMAEIGGKIEFRSDANGTRILARVPLPKTRDGQRGLFGLRR